MARLTRRRPVGLLVVLVAALGLVSARLVFVQFLDSERFTALAAVQREKRHVLAPERGSIFDRDGAELAISLKMETIFANPKFVADPKGTAEALASILSLPPGGPDGLEVKLAKKSGFVYLARKVDPAVAEKVRLLNLPGIYTAPESKRFYPAGSLAAHVVGFVGMDNEGLGGLESRFEKMLRGKPGEVLMERDPQGRPIPAGRSKFIPPVSGDDLVLTIDREIQFVAEQSLRHAVETWHAEGGSVIVMRPSTGEVLALANLPGFDPNDLRSSNPESRKNRAVENVYEPGSANKVITAAAALETGIVDSNDIINVPDHLKLGNKTFRDAHSHPVWDLTFADVIAQSSNVGTIKVAGRLGKDRLHTYLRKFGYGQPTGIDFPGESRGLLPKPESWWDTSLPTMAIGQGVAVTGMQIAGVYATVANDGVSVRPRLVRATFDPQGVVKPATPSEVRRVIKSQTARELTRILVGVTEGKHGTGSAAAIPGYQVAGKTGTAQKVAPGGGYSGYVGSFIGFAPAGDPQIVVGVILDNPSPIWGGVTAGPAFKEVMQFSLRHLGIGPGPVLRPQQGGGGTPLPVPVRSGDVAAEQPLPGAPD